MEYVEPPPPWEVGRQAILNDTGAREPEHRLDPPVPILASPASCGPTTARSTSTVALGWTGREVYVRMPEDVHQVQSAEDIQRHER